MSRKKAIVGHYLRALPSLNAIPMRSHFTPVLLEATAQQRHHGRQTHIMVERTDRNHSQVRRMLPRFTVFCMVPLKCAAIRLD
jgi:hypothetical protein